MNCMDGYDFGESELAALNNNLWTANLMISKHYPDAKPDLYILGGAAMAMHGLNYKFTLDIDCANRIRSDVREVLSEFAIDDAASEVAHLPSCYEGRLVRFREDLEYLNCYLLSVEDLFITKLLTKRMKDIQSIMTSGILKKIDREAVCKIVDSELEGKEKEDAIAWCRKLGISEEGCT